MDKQRVFYYSVVLQIPGHWNSRWKMEAPTRMRASSRTSEVIRSELGLKGLLRARWRCTITWKRSRRRRPLLNWRTLWKWRRKPCAFGSATNDTRRKVSNLLRHRRHRLYEFRPGSRMLLIIPPAQTICRHQFNQQVPCYHCKINVKNDVTNQIAFFFCFLQTSAELIWILCE